MISIYTLADKRPDFIKMQYDSMKKHIKDDFEYIVLNNAVDSVERTEEIKNICIQLDIKSIVVELIGELNNSSHGSCFNGNSYVEASRACLYPLTWLFQKKINDDEKICFIDSDMFFINDFSFFDNLNGYEMMFMPQYRKGFLYMAPAFVYLDLNKVKNYKEMDWDFHVSGGVVTDVGGKTNNFINNNLNFNKKFLEQYSIYDFVLNGNVAKVHLIINGNINYEITEEYYSNTLMSTKQIGGDGAVDNSRSFMHQNSVENYSQKLYSEYLKIKTYIDNKDFPKPIHLGFIKIMDENDFFIMHYQTGSNYADFSTQNYNNKKTEIINNIIQCL